MAKKIPLRQCVGCGEMKGKKEMLQALNPAAAAAAAAAAAPAPLPPGAAAKSIDNIKSKFGGLFGKKDKE